MFLAQNQKIKEEKMVIYPKNYSSTIKKIFIPQNILSEIFNVDLRSHDSHSLLLIRPYMK